jgi:hypothetical protein
MTTILADLRLGVMVSDGTTTDSDRVWSQRKVWRVKGCLVGIAGDFAQGRLFVEWLRGGAKGQAPKFNESEALVMSDGGLFYYGNNLVPEKVAHGIEAIGTGSKAAMCAYEALAFTDPVLAVKIVCKHDSGSRGPVRTYRLKA